MPAAQADNSSKSETLAVSTALNGGLPPHADHSDPYSQELERRTGKLHSRSRPQLLQQVRCA